MKKILFVFIVFFWIRGVYSQERKNIIFDFDKIETNVLSKDRDIYIFDKGLSFRYNSKEHSKILVKYDSIRDEIISVKNFKNEIIGKNILDYYDNHRFFIFKRKNDKFGCLIEVERIWLVEEKIID